MSFQYSIKRKSFNNAGFKTSFLLYAVDKKIGIIVKITLITLKTHKKQVFKIYCQN